jgi:hypothetical protein
MEGTELQRRVFENLATFEDLAKTDDTHPRTWRRRVESMGVRIVQVGRTSYVDVNDLKAKLSGGKKPGRGRPRKAA